MAVLQQLAKTRGNRRPLIFGDPDARPSTSTQALMEFYGLSHAEARLMAALVDGESLEDYADRRQISINTARTQSKQIFAKTGHGRQADLIREVLTNPVLRVRDRNPRPITEAGSVRCFLRLERNHSKRIYPSISPARRIEMIYLTSLNANGR